MKHLPILIFAIVLLATACSDSRYVAMLDRAEPLIETAPDTALALLDSIDSHRLARADNARYALLMSQALDKNYIDVTDDSLINIAVDYYQKHGNKHYKMLSHYYRGRVLYNAEDYARSIVALLTAEKVAKENESYFYLGLIYRNIAYVYNKIYYNVGETEYAQKSYEAFSKTNYSAYTDYALLVLAMAHYNNNDFHRCDSIVDCIFERPLFSNDENLSFQTHKLKANLLINNKEYAKSLAWLCQLETSYSQRFTAIDYIDLSLCYVANNDTINAYKYALQATELDTLESWGLYQINKKMGHNIKALHYLEKEVELQNMLIEKISSQTVLSEVNKYKEHLRIEENRKAKNTLITIILTSIILIAGAIVTAIIRIKIANAEMEKNIAMAHNLKNTLFIKNKYIEALQSDVNKLFSGQFEILNNLCSIYYENSDEKKVIYAIYKDVKSIIKKLGSDKNTIAQLEKLANEHLNNIMVDFRNYYGNLSNDDVQLFLYIVMGFSSRAISIILNIDINKVYNRKSSLKRKIYKRSDIDTVRFIHFLDK